MGSKGVKVIVLDDTGMKMREPKDPEKFKAANKEWVEGLRKNPTTGQGLPAYGTNVLTNVINEAGGLSDPQLPVGPFRGVLGHQRRNPGPDRDGPRGCRHPRVSPRLRHPLFRDLSRQGWALSDQAA